MGYFQVRTGSFREGNPVPPRLNVSTPQNPLWPVSGPPQPLAPLLTKSPAINDEVPLKS